MFVFWSDKYLTNFKRQIWRKVSLLKLTSITLEDIVWYFISMFDEYRDVIILEGEAEGEGE